MQIMSLRHYAILIIVTATAGIISYFVIKYIESKAKKDE
jgi:hypothetical protein